MSLFRTPRRATDDHSDVGRAQRRTELRARLEQQQAHRRELEGMGFRRDR